MGVRDALLLNQTGSNFQALQTNDTARLKGDLSLQKDDGTEVLGIDVSAATLNLTGGITGSGNISSSLSSTGSFGRVVATTFHGDGTSLRDTLPRSVGIVTQSAQLAAQISGAFTSGFEMSASISGSATSTGSFGRVEGEFFFGDGSGIKTTLPRSVGIVTGSAQLAADISGSFNKGFEFEGTIQTTPGGVFEASDNLPTSATGGTAGSMVAGNAIQASGIVSPYPYKGAQTQLYNGSSWSEVNDQNSSRDANGTTLVGTSAAALLFGGCSDGSTEEWNGTNWSEVNDGDTSMRDGQGTGESSEAAIFTYFAGGGNVEWNGTNWSEISNAGQQRYTAGMVGSRDSALLFGGYSGAQEKLTELWNGSSWSELNDMLEEFGQGFGFGSSNDGVAVGGSRPPIPGWPGGSTPSGTSSQLWNGTSWSTGPNMNTGRHQRFGYGGSQMTPSGVSNEGFVAGGSSGGHPHIQAATEIFPANVASASFGRIDATTITGDATPIINSLPFPSGLVSGSSILASDISGSFNKGFGLTGNITTPMDAWTTGHDMNTCRYYFGAKGYVDSAIAMGGGTVYGSPYAKTDNTEMWDGTSWTEVNNMNYARDGGYGGTVSSGYFSAGSTAPWSRSEEWNGTNWSEATAFGQRDGDIGGCSPTQVYNIGSMYDGGNHFDTYNAGVCTEGPVLSIGTCTPFSFKGSSGRFGHAGNADCLLVFTQCFTEEYNGTSWSVLSHNAGQNSGRYEGFTDANPNPAKLNGAATDRACSVRGNTGAGTTNDAYSYGGEVGPLGGPAWAFGCKTAMFQRWDGVSWSRGVIPPVFRISQAQGIGDGANAFVLGGRTYPGTAPHASIVQTCGSIFLEGQSSASFGLLTFVSASGNAKSLQSQLSYTTNPAFNVLTGSGQIASQISGSFNKGFEFSGQIKAASGGVVSLGDSLIEAQTGATGGSMNKGTAFVAGGVYGTSRETCACHQQYNGTSWSEAADLNDARKCLIEAAGDSSGAIVHGGPSGPGTVNGTEEWNGTAWTEVNTFYPARNVTTQIAAAGESSEAALRWGLYDAAEWNGTNWSEFQTTAESGLTGGHYNQSGTGTVNAALQFAGQTPHNFITTGYDRSFRAFREYNGSNWTECPNMIFMSLHNGAFGSSNDAVAAGGSIMPRTVDGAPGPYGCINHSVNFHPSRFSRSTYNQYWNGSAWSVTGRLLCRVTGCNTAGSGFGGASGGGASNQGFIAGGIYPSPSPYTTTATQLFNEVPVSGSFGRLDATTFHGDGSGLTNILPTGLVSGSAQLGISGSFTSGFEFSGEISGSVTSTGSFGRIESDFLHGDGSSIASSLPRSTGIVSGAAQIAADISGSFTSGFGYDGTIAGTFTDIITNGGFDADSDWTQKETGWTISGGKAVASNVGYSYTISQNVSEVQTGVEQTFRVTVTISDYSAGTLKWIIGTAGYLGASLTADGTYVQEITTTPSSTKIGLLGASGTALNCKIDNVKVEILSPALRSTTSASFHNVEVTSLSGDGSQFSASLQTQLLTGSSQIAADISGSFTNGIELQGGVSASLGLYGGTWSEVNPLNQARAGGAVGNKAAALASAGRPPGGAPYASTCTELWNGVNWSVATARSNVGGGTSIAGNSEAAVSHQVPTTANHTEIWNGTSWSDGSTVNAHQLGGTDMVGTVDAAIEAGGFNGSSQVQSDAAEWNGATWSEATALPAARGGGSFSGIQNDAMYSGGSLPTPQGGIQTSTVLYNGTNWSTGVALPILSYRQAGDGSANSSIHAGAHPASPGAWPQYNAYEFGGLAWYRVADMTRSPAGAYDMDIAGDPKGALGVGGYIVNNTEEFSSYGNNSSGSFERLRGTVGGEIKTDMLNITSSTFKLPLFSDADLNYNPQEPQESTGSISGSVVRAGDVNIFNKPGNFFFHSDYNALGFTYVSASVYSQSLDFTTCTYQSASTYTSSQGFITQSHYCYHNVVQYITGSYT